MTTFVALDKRQRNPATYTSNSFAVPALLNRRIAFTLPMDVADIADTSISIRFAAQASFDPTGTNWIDLFGGVWTGGVDGEGNPKNPPNQVWSTSGPLPLFIRAELDINKRISIGLTIDAD